MKSINLIQTSYKVHSDWKIIFKDSQTIKGVERVEEQVVVEVLVQVQEEGHVPVLLRKHERPLDIRIPLSLETGALEVVLGLKGSAFISFVSAFLSSDWW